MAFQQGQSGNPSGRPVGSSNKRTQLVKLLEPHAPALIEKCVQMALNGNEACLRLAIDKLIPRAKDEPVNIDFGLDDERIQPEALAKLGENILRKVEAGLLTPEQAKTILGTFKLFREIISPADDESGQPLTFLEMMANQSS